MKTLKTCLYYFANVATAIAVFSSLAVLLYVEPLLSYLAEEL